jgi:hypothetical protein
LKHKPKPGVVAAQQLQRRQLAVRSAGQCEMQEQAYIGPQAPAGIWGRCRNRAVHAAHIIPRRFCAEYRDELVSVVHACERHHREWDDWRTRGKTVRVPEWLHLRIWNLLIERSREKNMPPPPNKYARWPTE